MKRTPATRLSQPGGSVVTSERATGRMARIAASDAVEQPGRGRVDRDRLDREDDAAERRARDDADLPARRRAARARPAAAPSARARGVIARAAGLPTTFAMPGDGGEREERPELRRARERDEDERDGDRDGEHERRGRDGAPRQPVGDLPRRKREDRQRQELHQADEAEVERVAVDRVDLPADRDREHLRREAVREERRPEKREVADLQRGREALPHAAAG